MQRASTSSTATHSNAAGANRMLAEDFLADFYQHSHSAHSTNKRHSNAAATSTTAANTTTTTAAALTAANKKSIRNKMTRLAPLESMIHKLNESQSQLDFGAPPLLYTLQESYSTGHLHGAPPSMMPNLAPTYSTPMPMPMPMTNHSMQQIPVFQTMNTMPLMHPTLPTQPVFPLNQIPLQTITQKPAVESKPLQFEHIPLVDLAHPQASSTNSTTTTNQEKKAMKSSNVTPSQTTSPIANKSTKLPDSNSKLEKKSIAAADVAVPKASSVKSQSKVVAEEAKQATPSKSSSTSGNETTATTTSINKAKAIQEVPALPAKAAPSQVSRKKAEVEEAKEVTGPQIPNKSQSKSTKSSSSSNAAAKENSITEDTPRSTASKSIATNIPKHTESKKEKAAILRAAQSLSVNTDLTDFYLNDEVEYDPQIRAAYQSQDNPATNMSVDIPGNASVVSQILSDIQQKKQNKESFELQRKKKVASTSAASTPKVHTENIHYISHLQHKAAAISGQAPSIFKVAEEYDEETFMDANESIASSPPKIPSHEERKQKTKEALDNNVTLAKRMEEVQLQLLQESNTISGLMGRIVEQYEALKELNENVLYHRKELGMKVEQINTNYIQLFEEMLREVMKVQRVKFKSQTKVVEDLKQVNHKLTNLIHEKEDFICQLEKDKADLQQEKALIQQSFESSKKVWEKTLIDQQNQFRVQSKEMEHNFHVQQSNVAEDLKTSLSKEFQQRHQSKVQDISQSFQIEIQGLHTQLQRKQLEYQHLNQDYQQLKNRWEQVTAGQDVLLAKDIFNNHLQQVAFKYPSKTQSTQTEIDFEEEGLWDKQHGWILPISKNCLIRKKWRQVLNYSRCPSCHGNGQFISQVASILRQSTMGGISNNTAYLIPAYLPPANTNKTGNSGKKAKKKSMTKTDHAVVDNSTASNADHTPKKQSNASKSTDAIMTPTTLVEGNVVDNKVPHYITNTYKDTLDYDTLRDMMMHGKKTPYFVDDKYNGHYLQYAKIRMPDDLIHFLTNLPHAIQAMHNMSSIWTIAMTYAIMHYKYFFADREDCKHHFTIQSMAHYVIVHFLQYLPYNRIYSEYILYIYLRSMKTYYPQSHLLSIMLRAMEVLDEYSSTEKSLISQYLQQSQDILQRKKHALLQNMKIRDRQKALQQQEEQQSSTFAGQNSQAITSALVAKSIYDEEYALSSHALSTEVNEVMLFARHCLLYSPYKGVYRKPIDHVASQFPEFFNKFESVMNTYTSDMWKTVVDQYQHLPSISRMHSVDPNDFHTNADRPRDMQYIALPKHVLCPMYPTGSRHNDNAGYQLHHFYMPLDRAVHVLQAFIEQINQPIVIHHHVDIYQHTAPSTTASKVVMNAVAIMKVFRSLEETTVCLHSDGSIYTPDGLNTFIRSTMRLFIQAYKPHCVDISTWDEIANLYRRQGADAEGSTDEVNSSSRAIFASSLDKDEKSTKEINLAILMTEVVKYTLMVDMDYVLLLLIQIIQQRVKYIESTLYKLFIDGDVNHDNVLSYTEFRDIVLQIPNHDGSLCPERKIIRMFRDALSQGQDNDCIGPEAFVDVCKKYQIIDLVDWRSLREDRVAGLVHPEDYTPPPAKKEKEPKPALFQVESDSSEEEKSEDDHDCDEEVEEDYDDSFDSVNNGKADYAVGGGGGGIIAQKFRKIRKVVEVQKKKTQPNRMVIATKKVSMTNDSLQPEPEPIQMVATLVEAPTATNPLPAKPKKLHIPTHMDVPHVSEINEDLSREASSKILQELQLRKQKRNQAPAAAQL